MSDERKVHSFKKYILVRKPKMCIIDLLPHLWGTMPPLFIFKGSINTFLIKKIPNQFQSLCLGLVHCKILLNCLHVVGKGQNTLQICCRDYKQIKYIEV